MEGAAAQVMVGGAITDSALTTEPRVRATTVFANKALQKTQTALGSFSILLSHNGLLPVHGSLPVARARFGLLSAGVGRQG
jgi:hypothetical protein